MRNTAWEGLNFFYILYCFRVTSTTISVMMETQITGPNLRVAIWHSHYEPHNASYSTTCIGLAVWICVSIEKKNGGFDFMK